MATNKELYDESSRKTYNNIDSNEQLMYVEVTKNTFAGYRPKLLVRSLSQLETDFYICTECKGVMRNACQTGEEQNPVCDACVEEGVFSQTMVKSRNKILELQAECPLATRGCNWNGKIANIEEHLIVCEKVVVECYNACDVILPKSELKLHLIHSCVKRSVTCEHCDEDFIYEELTNHSITCLEYQFPCPNNCSVNLKRKLLDSHLEFECPNMVVECPYKKFGCSQGVLRCELEEHKKTNQVQHLEFAICEMEQLKQINLEQTETIKQLTEMDMQQIKRMITLENQVTSLAMKVEKVSYPIILRDELQVGIPTITNNRTIHSFIPIKVIWKFLKISVEFEYHSLRQITFVSVIMENDNIRAPFVKWPFEGRFKLTTVNNKNEPTIYESDIIKLQPQNVSKDKGKYPSQLFLADIPSEDLQEGRSTAGRLKFTLQIQEI